MSFLIIFIYAVIIFAVVIAIFAWLYERSSRETAITRAINKVGPAVASINVEQHIPSISLDPFFGFSTPLFSY